MLQPYSSFLRESGCITVMQRDMDAAARKTKHRRVASLICTYIFLVILTILTVLPFLWMLSGSLQSERDLFRANLKWIPNPLHWENYTRVVTEIPFARYFYNTLKISLIVVLLQVLTSAMMGYSLAKLEYPGRKIILLIYLSAMMIPFQVIMVPQFLLVKDLGLVNTHIAVILLHAFSPFGVFLVRQFFMNLPSDLLEAAEIDGAGYIKQFVYIVLPLGLPALSSLAIRTFIFTMNDFLMPFLYLNDKALRTIPVGLRSLTTEYHSNYGLQLAGSTLALLPVLIVYALGSNQIINGISMGGGGSIKG